MERIFVSYSRVDEVFARRLAVSLAEMGADVWIDIDDIEVGTKWSSAIQHGLDTAKALIVVLSPDSMASSNVEDEWQYALDHDVPVVPVLLREAKVHFQLNRLQYIDFLNQPYQTALRQLHTQLERKGLKLSRPSGTPTMTVSRPLDTPERKPATPSTAQSMMTNRNLVIGGTILASVLVIGLIAFIALNLDDNNANNNNPTQAAQVLTQDTGDVTATASATTTATATATATTTTIGLSGSPVSQNADWSPVYGTGPLAGMVLVPAGSFTMGSSNLQGNNTHDEAPTTHITFAAPFWIDRTEYPEQGSDLPRAEITWQDAQAVCAAEGKRLPTEAEWEYAARGPDGLEYPWGNTFDSSVVNLCDVNCDAGNWRDATTDDGYAGRAPVTAFPRGASWVGALNMSGNLWEWTSTIYRDYPYNANDGRENPGDLSSYRTLRGSSWNWIRADARTTSRDDQVQPSSPWYGFRCARDFQPGDVAYFGDTPS